MSVVSRQRAAEFLEQAITFFNLAEAALRDEDLEIEDLAALLKTADDALGDAHETLTRKET